jgi:hypothetical protein
VIFIASGDVEQPAALEKTTLKVQGFEKDSEHEQPSHQTH